MGPYWNATKSKKPGPGTLAGPCKNWDPGP